ncbi:MAG: hypothetical protein U0941_30055 [Planctomycetaceae bacterium]
MTKRILRSDAPSKAQVTRLAKPQGEGEIHLTILGSGKDLVFTTWDATAVATAWNASTWPEFMEATAAASGTDVLLTSRIAGRPFYVAATVGGNQFGNCKQTITPVNVTGGTTAATWNAQTTTTFNPVTTTAAQLKAKFEALPGGIVATDELTWSGPTGGPWTVEFGGRYAEQPVPLISLTQGSLTGGTAARNEQQRLFLTPGASNPIAFMLRRPDDLQTTNVLRTPLTAAQCQTALASIGYTTTCTGGNLTAGGQATQSQGAAKVGRFNATSLVDDTANFFTTIGAVTGEASLSTGLFLFNLAQPQSQTIDLSQMRLWFRNDAQSLAGVTIKAVLAPNATWPANAATAAANTLTTASATFDVAAGDPRGNGENRYIDITPIIQELVNQGSWTSGNAVLLYVIPPATSHFAKVNSVGSGGYVWPLLVTTTSTSGAPITIEWTGANAGQNIPELLVVPEGGYTFSPSITTIQNGAPAIAPAINVAITVNGGESLVIRDTVRSRGPNHYDDPLNWEPDDGTEFRVPEDGDPIYIESGKVDLLYGLNQRCTFVALPATEQLRATSVHHWWEGQAVQLITTGTLPGGLSANTRYYVVSVDGPYFRLSTTRGGNPVAITSAGSGIHVAGVKLFSAEIESRWTGKLGLARFNTSATTYFEYRERFLSLWCPTIKLGAGNGGGSNRVNIDTGTMPVTYQAIASGGAIETGVNAVLWVGDNAANQIECLAADMGIAIFPEQLATFDKLIQRGGSVALGRNVTGQTLDKTGGSFISQGATIAGKQYQN